MVLTIFGIEKKLVLPKYSNIDVKKLRRQVNNSGILKKILKDDAEWESQMGKFYNRIAKIHNSESPKPRFNHLSSNPKPNKANFIQEKIIINPKDQNPAFWDLEQKFGSTENLLSMSQEQRKEYIQKYGEQAFAQGYIHAKMMKRFHSKPHKCLLTQNLSLEPPSIKPIESDKSLKSKVRPLPDPKCRN